MPIARAIRLRLKPGNDWGPAEEIQARRDDEDALDATIDNVHFTPSMLAADVAARMAAALEEADAAGVRDDELMGLPEGLAVVREGGREGEASPCSGRGRLTTAGGGMG